MTGLAASAGRLVTTRHDAATGSQAALATIATNLSRVLRATSFVDSDHPEVIAFAARAQGDARTDRERASLLASLSAYFLNARRVTVRQDDGAESVLLTQVSWDLFSTLGVRPAVGREFQAAEGERGGPAVAIVSDGYWKRSLGGARDVVGRTLPLGVGASPGTVTVVGVMPPGFRFAYDVDVWVPMQRNAQGTDVRRFHNWMLLVANVPDMVRRNHRRHAWRHE